MFKSAVISLVLGAISIANAGLAIDPEIVYRVNGGNYAPDATTPCQVNATGDVTVILWNLADAKLSPVFGGVTDIGYVATGDAIGMKITSVTVNNTNLPGEWSEDDTYYNTYHYGVWEINLDIPALYPTLAGELVTITMAGVEYGDTFVMYDLSWNNLDAGIVFVPKPTTMALLTVGGIFLTRKNKY